VGLARAAGLSVVLLVATSPVVLLAGCENDPVVRVYHTDHLGSAQVVTDWSGNVYRQVRYTAYGEIRGRFNSAGNPVGFAEDARFEFTGYETDFAGLDYAGARFFDPELAQFASHDPAGQYASPYAYGPGDPVNGSDPSGEIFEVLAAMDAYHETGSARAAVRVGLDASFNTLTGGIYGATQAYSAGEIGSYLAEYGANQLTGGWYGMVYGPIRAFKGGQELTGIAGVVMLVLAVYGVAKSVGSGSGVVSGKPTQFAFNDVVTTDPSPMMSTILSAVAVEGEPLWQTAIRIGLYDWKEPLGGSYVLEALSAVGPGRLIKGARIAVRVAKALDPSIAKVVKRFSRKSLSEQKALLQRMRRTLEKHYERGGGDHWKEVPRMKKEIQAMEEILRSRGQGHDQPE